MTTRIGILGGTFDPIHYGHLAIAEEARVLLQFDRVLLVPAAQQPLKRGRHVATPTQRLEMARLACADNPYFDVSPIEVEREGPSYTVDTLRTLDAAGLGDLHFILGADAAAELYRWYAAPTIIELAQIVAVGRPRRHARSRGARSQTARAGTAASAARRPRAGDLQQRAAPAHRGGPADPLPDARRCDRLYRGAGALSRRRPTTDPDLTEIED